jgi:hypothetical protein
VGEGKCVRSFGGKLREKVHLEDVDIDGKVIVKWILKKQNGGGVDLSGFQ